MYGYYVSNNNDALSIIDYLVENCYIDSSNMISEYEDITFFQYCEVCGLYRPDWFKAYCYYRYNNNNIIMMTMAASVVIVVIKA